jgi:hypothetical protein
MRKIDVFEAFNLLGSGAIAPERVKFIDVEVDEESVPNTTITSILYYHDGAWYLEIEKYASGGSFSEEEEKPYASNLEELKRWLPQFEYAVIEDKLFVVRDQYGYVISAGGNELSTNQIKWLFGLDSDASLEYASGSWGWETETDWCDCGDLDCRPRVRNDGEKYCEK